MLRAPIPGGLEDFEECTGVTHGNTEQVAFTDIDV